MIVASPDNKTRKRSRRRVGASSPGSHHHARFKKRQKKRDGIKRAAAKRERYIKLFIPRRKNEPGDRPMVCDKCGSTGIITNENAGWDIGPGFEEKQHVDKCCACGATRDWCEFIQNDHPTKRGRYSVHWGQWREPYAIDRF